jgi:hypothetical protein
MSIVRKDDLVIHESNDTVFHGRLQTQPRGITAELCSFREKVDLDTSRRKTSETLKEPLQLWLEQRQGSTGDAGAPSTRPRARVSLCSPSGILFRRHGVVLCDSFLPNLPSFRLKVEMLPSHRRSSQFGALRDRIVTSGLTTTLSRT